jgi:hypothetical protein
MVRKEQPRVILDVHLLPCNPSARRPVARPRQAALARSGTAAASKRDFTATAPRPSAASLQRFFRISGSE